MYLLKWFFHLYKWVVRPFQPLPFPWSVCVLPSFCLATVWLKGLLAGFLLPSLLLLYYISNFSLARGTLCVLDKVSVAFYKAKNGGSFQDLSLSLQSHMGMHFPVTNDSVSPAVYVFPIGQSQDLSHGSQQVPL